MAPCGDLVPGPALTSCVRSAPFLSEHRPEARTDGSRRVRAPLTCRPSAPVNFQRWVSLQTYSRAGRALLFYSNQSAVRDPSPRANLRVGSGRSTCRCHETAACGTARGIPDVETRSFLREERTRTAVQRGGDREQRLACDSAALLSDEKMRICFRGSSLLPISLISCCHTALRCYARALLSRARASSPEVFLEWNNGDNFRRHRHLRVLVRNGMTARDDGTRT
ncbi:unnamed protein product [Boreogadus saida]